jgi:hypothetical protein
MRCAGETLSACGVTAVKGKLAIFTTDLKRAKRD